MIDSIRAAGGCNYSGHAEYDNLSGYVTGNYTAEWQDKDGTRWRTVTTIINLGRPDRGIPVDPDKAMVEEEWVDEEQLRIDDQRRAATVERNRVERHRLAMERLVTYMQEHGPSPVVALLEVTDWASKSVVVEHLEMFPDVYLRFWDRPMVWGLHGQTYRHRHEDRPVIVRVQDALMEHGPLTIKELMAATRASKSAVEGLVVARLDMFVRIEKREQRLVGRNPVLWGVKGVHDATHTD